MDGISELYKGRPQDKRIDAEEQIYSFLEKCGIEFYRVDHSHADTMEDCLAVEKVLGAKICKNLFLCNRQQTEFYLLLMPGDKVFKTKELTGQLNCSRLSFAGADFMRELLHTVPGSVSGLELLFDTDNRIRLVIDRDLLNDEYISGHPGISTSTLKIKKDDMLVFFEKVNHSPVFVDLTGEE